MEADKKHNLNLKLGDKNHKNFMKSVSQFHLYDRIVKIKTREGVRCLVVFGDLVKPTKTFS